MLDGGGRVASSSQVDPRIHFALNCGARSCPPVKLFTPDGLHGELQAAAAAFVAAEVSVPDETGEVGKSSRLPEDNPSLLVWRGSACRDRLENISDLLGN